MMYFNKSKNDHSFFKPYLIDNQYLSLTEYYSYSEMTKGKMEDSIFTNLKDRWIN